MLDLLISKTAVSWSWPVWCSKIALDRPDSREVSPWTMLSVSAHTPHPFDWRDLYLQALFEADHKCIHARIAEAKRALIRREHELFADPAAKAERGAVTDALNALYALQTCLKLEAAGSA